ncbi:MAG: Verru_Chthon cassette protein D [Candidatus Methylacidiphilales bacterium]
MAAFSLIELIVVVAIAALLMVLAVPAFQRMALGSSITRSGQMVEDQLALARQMAVSRNGQVQVRLVWLSHDAASCRAIQLWGDGAALNEMVPLTRLTLLPDGISVAASPTLSPMLNDSALTTLKASAAFPGYGTLKYCGFRFRAGGRTDLPFDATNAFLTIAPARHSADTVLPANYCIVQIDPVTGRAKTYRP